MKIAWNPSIILLCEWQIRPVRLVPCIFCEVVAFIRLAKVNLLLLWEWCLTLPNRFIVLISAWQYRLLHFRMLSNINKYPGLKHQQVYFFCQFYHNLHFWSQVFYQSFVPKEVFLNVYRTFVSIVVIYNKFTFFLFMKASYFFAKTFAKVFMLPWICSKLFSLF